MCKYAICRPQGVAAIIGKIILLYPISVPLGICIWKMILAKTKSYVIQGSTKKIITS